jgi:hypothetical protein
MTRKRGKFAIAVGLLVLLAVVVVYAPIAEYHVSATFAFAYTDVTVTLNDSGSIAHGLFGFGTAPFTHEVADIIVVNGSTFTVFYDSEIGWAMLPGLQVPAPIVATLDAAVNETTSGVLTVSVSIQNNAQATVDALDVLVSGVSLGFMYNITSGHSLSQTFMSSPDTLPRHGDSLPIRLYGTLNDDKFFVLYTTVNVA